MRLRNIQFEIRDVASIQEFEKYDLIIAFDTIHDQAQPINVLKEIYNSLKRDNGVFLMQDIAASSYVHNNIGNPLAPTLYTLFTMHV